MTLSAADLTPDQLADSWRNDGCDYCQQTTGHRCRTSSDNLCPPHTNRRVKYAAFLNGQASRQTEVDGLTAQVTSLKAANDQLDATLAGADAQNDTLAKRVTTLTAQLADAQATIAQLEQPPEPTTLYGMNVSPGTAFTSAAKETAADVTKRLLSTYGTLPTSKVFYSGALPATFNTSLEGLVAGRHVYVCFKSYTLANLTTYLASVPAGWTVTLIYFQEPDDEMWVDKSMTVADFTAKTAQVLATVKASTAGKDGRARVGSCFMEYSLTSGRWTDAVVVPGIDVVAFDFYTNTKPDDPTKRIAAMAATAKRAGASWAVLEIGDRPTTFADGNARASYWGGAFDQMAAGGAEALVWFDQIGTTGDHRIIPGQPYSDPLLGVLKARMTPEEP